MKKLKRFCIVSLSEIPDSWHSGDPYRISYIEAVSAESALDKAWKEKKFNTSNLSCTMRVYANADDYHQHKNPIAQRYKGAADRYLCHSPNCPYC